MTDEIALDAKIRDIITGQPVQNITSLTLRLDANHLAKVEIEVREIEPRYQQPDSVYLVKGEDIRIASVGGFHLTHVTVA